MLLQRILPIGLRGFAHKDISIVLFELGSFFQDLCSKTLKRSELEKLEECIVLILCKLVRFFPPALNGILNSLINKFQECFHPYFPVGIVVPIKVRWDHKRVTVFRDQGSTLRSKDLNTRANQL